MCRELDKQKLIFPVLFSDVAKTLRNPHISHGKLESVLTTTVYKLKTTLINSAGDRANTQSAVQPTRQALVLL